MADKAIQLEVVTPEKIVLQEEVDFVVAPGSEGFLGILPDHAPIITSLAIGVAKIKKGNEETLMAVSGGFLEVKNNVATILADTAEKPDEIDVNRAKAAKERAEQRLASQTADIDVARAEAALKRALSRIQASGK